MSPLTRFRLGIAFASLLLAAAAKGIELPDDFRHEVLVGGPFMAQPVGFDFLTDGRFLLIERTNQVRIATAGDSTSQVILTIPGVSTGGERGLLGLAVDPDWPARPYVYFSFTHEDAVSRIEMYTASGDLSDPSSPNLVLSDPYILLDAPDDSSWHNAGTLRFGPDGMLYASIGDDQQACDAQAVSSLHGKILRLDVSRMPGPGRGPPPTVDITPRDNPFSGPDANARLVYAWGLRNPFRFTIDRVSGDLLIGDVGASGFEEIDLAPADCAARNFGWPMFEAFSPRGDAFGLCGESNSFTEPIHVIPHGVLPVAVIGGPIIRGTGPAPAAFPPSYEGDYFFFELFSGELRRIRQISGVWDLAPSVPGQPSPQAWGTGLAGVSDARLGPDGALYFVSMGLGRLPWGLGRILRDPSAGPDPDSTSSPTTIADFRQLRAFPNPGSAGSLISFGIPQDAPAEWTLGVYDVAGRVVDRVSSQGCVSEHPRVFTWASRSATGAALMSGTYVAQLEVAGKTIARTKITLLQ